MLEYLCKSANTPDRVPETGVTSRRQGFTLEPNNVDEDCRLQRARRCLLTVEPVVKTYW